MVELERGHLKRYPHQLSGGQQQRVAVARAMITEPDCVVLDEPTASQDAPVKVQLLGLLGELQEKLGVAYLFISHDLSTVRSLCHRVLVMYLGKIVEEGPAGRVFDNPLHPYTRALISAIPVPDPKRNREVLRLPGETQSLTRLIPACSLQDRCPFVRKECREQDPPLRILNADHRVACFHAFEQARAGDHGAQAV
jgi:peptide/nickel transport system ATP-binding protein